MHPWGVRVDRPDRPDRVIFDLDPGEGLGFADLTAAALDVRKLLEGSGLQSFTKTTGGKGLHVVVPIERRHDWPTVKAFAKRVAETMSGAAPERFLPRISKAERRGRIFIDYLRNDPTSTAVAPYSTRSRPGAPVATPLTWEELEAGIDPASFHVRSVPERLQKGGDPWREIATMRQRLPA
jgi:bifunctional non-homologous end joining protein LigD